MEANPIVDGLRPRDDTPSKIYRVNQVDLELVYKQPFWRCTPLILALSSTKVFYTKPVRDFWLGLSKAGGLNLSIGIIGYSLPIYDSYVRQVMYDIVNNFLEFEPNWIFEGRYKSKLRILDYRTTPDEVSELKAHYRFIDWTKTECWLEGLTEEGADWILR